MNIHCSVTEGFCFSIIEASAVSTPIVAYNVPGVTETVEDGKNGKLVEDGNGGQRRNLSGISWISSSIGSARKYSWDKTAFTWEKDLKAIGEWSFQDDAVQLQLK